MKLHNQHSNIGIVWYSKEEWEKMKQISIDSERLEASFEQWEKMAQKTLFEMKATGIIGTKVLIKSEDFLVWCKIHSLPLDAASRSEYVSEIMSKRNSNK
ncbi:MAG: hypothetical protein M1495_14850 [Bacteroidetes bacterium]|nr:hypothetical protein [Bacteroidota bacterium]